MKIVSIIVMTMGMKTIVIIVILHIIITIVAINIIFTVDAMDEMALVIEGRFFQLPKIYFAFPAVPLFDDFLFVNFNRVNNLSPQPHGPQDLTLSILTDIHLIF